jgi:hypothetical protein
MWWISWDSMINDSHIYARRKWEATARSMMMYYHNHIVYGYTPDSESLEGLLNVLFKLDLWLKDLN